MSRTVAEILADAKKLVQGLPRRLTNEAAYRSEPYEEPWINKYIHRKYYQVLAPVGFEWTNSIEGWFIGEQPNPSVEACKQFLNEMLMGGVTIVIHGHSRGKGCSLPAQCHVLGWRPPEDAPREFLENWKRFGYDER